MHLAIVAVVCTIIVAPHVSAFVADFFNQARECNAVDRLLLIWKVIPILHFSGIFHYDLQYRQRSNHIMDYLPWEIIIFKKMKQIFLINHHIYKLMYVVS